MQHKHDKSTKTHSIKCFVWIIPYKPVWASPRMCVASAQTDPFSPLFLCHTLKTWSPSPNVLVIICNQVRTAHNSYAWEMYCCWSIATDEIQLSSWRMRRHLLATMKINMEKHDMGKSFNVLSSSVYYKKISVNRIIRHTHAHTKMFSKNTVRWMIRCCPSIFPMVFV